MSSKIYICDGLSNCQWCSKDIYRGSKMLRFDGFSYGAVSKFVDAVLQHKKNGLNRKIVRFMNQDILNKIMSYIIDENVQYGENCVGASASNALIALIYEKQLKLYPSASEQFSEGEIINFV